MTRHDMNNTGRVETAASAAQRSAWFWPVVVGLSAFAAFGAGRWTAPRTTPPAMAPGGVVVTTPIAPRITDAPTKPTSGKHDPSTATAWKAEWQNATQQPSSAKRENELAVLLERFAAIDSSEAARLALAEPNLKVRAVLIGAVLRGWGGVAPREAIAWSVAHVDEQVRREIHQSLITGLAASGEPPDQLLVLLCRTDPELAADYGIALVHELARHNRFQEAVHAAMTASPERLDHWTGAAFRKWAEYQPEDALNAAAAVTDPSARSTALQNIATGWAAASPATMARYAEQLPPGEWRQTVLREALQSWVRADTAAAIKWIEKYDPEPALDSGTAAIATLPALIAVKPDIAASWAESIVDPELRESTLGDVIRLWARADAEAARKYALTSNVLDPVARAHLLDGLVP
jgi:hypothetical protein